MDHALVDFVIEILDVDLAEPDTNYLDAEAPQCVNLPCFIGGQKAYNEFHNFFEVGPKTSFRLWLFKHTETHETTDCGKFQMQLEFIVSKPKQANAAVCSELDIPTTFNSERYLGEQ